jgi:predicted DNA-binding protein (UPF0251 family)
VLRKLERDNINRTGGDAMFTACHLVHRLAGNCRYSGDGHEGQRVSQMRGAAKMSVDKELRLTIDAPLLGELIFATGMIQETFAERVGVSVRTLRRTLARGEMRLGLAMMIAAALGCRVSTFVTDPRCPSHVDGPFRTDTADPVPTPGGGNQRTLQDMKTVLTARPLTDRLLDGGNPPLLDVVEATQMLVASSDSDRDVVKFDGYDFNHFCQPSLVLRVRVSRPDGLYVLAYNRIPNETRLAHVHTQGMAILWALKFTHGTTETTELPIEDWKEQARRNPACGADFYQGQNPVILRLAENVLRFPDRLCRISPLGVVTKDERPDTPRVYTQYVFLAEVDCESEAHLKPLLRSIVQGNRAYEPLGLRTTEYREILTDAKKNRPNRMDIAVWQAILSDCAIVREESAQFVRGFDLTGYPKTDR